MEGGTDGPLEERKEVLSRDPSGKGLIEEGRGGQDEKVRGRSNTVVEQDLSVHADEKHLVPV